MTTERGWDAGCKAGRHHALFPLEVGISPTWPSSLLSQHSSQVHCDLSSISEEALVSNFDTDFRKAGQSTPTLENSKGAWILSDMRQKPQLSFLKVQHLNLTETNRCTD